MPKPKKLPTLTPGQPAPAPVKKPKVAKPAAEQPPRGSEFGQWRKEGGRWIHASGDAAVSEKRLIAKGAVRGVTAPKKDAEGNIVDEGFPKGQLWEMITERRDELLNTLRKEDAKAKGGLFTRPEDEE